MFPAGAFISLLCDKKFNKSSPFLLCKKPSTLNPPSLGNLSNIVFLIPPLTAPDRDWET